jgi:hypothetical protein
MQITFLGSVNFRSNESFYQASFAQPLVQTIKRLCRQVKGKSSDFPAKISKNNSFSNQELPFPPDYLHYRQQFSLCYTQNK